MIYLYVKHHRKTGLRMAAKLKGRKMTEEHKQKISQALKKEAA